jgi:putative tricarboxylic transport membrane protein
LSLTARAVPALLAILALAYGLAARRYTVSFVADPLGPRAAPWLLAALLLLCALVLLARPGTPPAWPGRDGLRRVGLAALAIAAYVALLDPLGFVLATALFVGALARIAGGPFLAGGAAGLVFATGLYYLFVFALDLPLPIGRLFPFLGG